MSELIGCKLLVPDAGWCLRRIALALLLSTPPAAISQMVHHPAGPAVIPRSGQSSPGDLGVRAHTNIRFFFMDGASPGELPPLSGYGYETPASLACVYRLVYPVPGCNPNQTLTNSSGGSGSIAIVDAYDDPNAASDLASFSEQFGLPPANLSVVYEGGSPPATDPTGGWELEESLDIEYAHAMAPGARLYLVEANSNSFLDLFTSTQIAGNLVACGSGSPCPAGSKGRGQVTMSFSGAEFPTESYLDALFTTPNVEYFGTAGDEAGVTYPCASPNVICVGGTSTARSQFTGNLIAEIAWSDAGGGISAYEPIPRYQAAFPGLDGQLLGFRGVPDVSADANPVTGAWVLDNFPYEAPAGYETGWFIVGGTSLATPTVAGIFNATGRFEHSSYAALDDIYSRWGQRRFRDITYGACGYYSGSFSGQGWDLCTGFGSPDNLRVR
jgi:kumamolisin